MTSLTCFFFIFSSRIFGTVVRNDYSTEIFPNYRMNPLENFFFYLVVTNIPYGCSKEIFRKNIHDKYSIRRFKFTLIPTMNSIQLYINIILHDYFIEIFVLFAPFINSTCRTRRKHKIVFFMLYKGLTIAFSRLSNKCDYIEFSI